MRWEEWYAVADDEARWQGYEEKGLLKAEFLQEYVLRLWFEEELDVSSYELDFFPLLVTDNPGSVFAPLKELARFRLVEGNYALIWPNPDTGAHDEQMIDLAPECVRFFCERYGKPVKLPERSMVALVL
jgi:hypothetical protein